MRRLPLDEVQLHFVDSPETLAAFAAWEPEGMVACDIETTGLQPYGKNRDKIRLVQFGDENTGWAIPFGGTASRNAIQDALTVFAGRLVGHNARFDEAFLGQARFDTGPQWDDSYILHHLSFPLDYHGLKSVAGKFYGQAARAGEKWLDQVKRKTHTDWATVEINHPAYWGYAAFDCVLTCRIWNDMAGQHDDTAGRQMVWECYARELRVARLMAEVAERGMPVDMEYGQALLTKWAEEAEEIAKHLAWFQIEKPGSSAQIAAALANDGWEPDELTETGKPSVNRAVLEGLDNEIARLVLRWRRVTKWSKSYVEPMLASGGHLHCNISSLRAATGRMAIDSPPLQQLPKGPEVRAMLLADKDTELWAIDFTGQEARLLAAYIGNDEFTHEVLTGGDIHGNIARSLYGEDYTKEQRGWAKNAFYAYCYGAAQHRLSLTAHAPGGRFEKAVAEAYPAIAGFMKDVISTGKRRLEQDGMAWARTLGGRTVAVPKSRIYALTNYIMQGGGADMMKMALIKIDKAGLSQYVRLVIHDEVLCAFPKGQGAEMAATVKACMETTFRGVPFEAHATGPGESWGDVA